MADKKGLETKIKVMIADDDYYVRESLRMLLSKDHRTTVVDTATSTDEILGKIASPQMQPDVILLDVKFEGEKKSGLDIIPDIRKKNPKVKILVTSMVKQDKTVLSAIEAGANGFVWKNETGDGIASAIQKIYEDRFVVTKSIAENLLGKTIELKNYAVEVLPEKKEYQDLTEALRKTMYLYCFCGMSAKEIADELSVAVSTVNSRIKLAYAVLHATNRAEAFEQLVARGDEI